VVNGEARAETLLTRLEDVGVTADAVQLKLRQAAAADLFLVAQCESVRRN
jgi:hypothetical protein